MHTNIKPANCPDAVLPAPIIGFEDEIFYQIDPEGLGSRTANTDLVFDAVRAIRGAEIKQALAEVAKEKAESANAAKSDFLANMSHEIRTPMGAIIGLSHILLSTKLDGRQKKCLTALQSSAEAVMAMIDDMLDIGRIESRMIDLKLASFNMTALLDQIVDIMSVRAQEKNIGLTLRYEAGPPGTFVGDSGRIRQIIMNLIGNAIKFTETGGVTVSFAESGTENGKKQISISVIDTGIGIPEDKIAVIFGRFIQADSSIVRKYGGTGLGLAITKALTENMGGTIVVTSAAGKGSTFALHLQLSVEESSGDSENNHRENIIYLNISESATKA